MNPWIRIHQNDAGIVLAFTCRDEMGNPVDLTGLNVEFLLLRNGTPINTDHATCAKTSASTGLAEYTIQGTDSTETGLLHGVLKLSSGIALVRQIGGIPIEVAATV